MFEAHVYDLGEFGFVEAQLSSVFVFGLQRRVKHRWVIGGEDDRDAVAPELRQRMILHTCVGEMQLIRECAGADVALRTNFERNAVVDEQVHERGILRGGDAVADALDVQQFDGFADFIGAADFSRVHQQVKVIFRSMLIHWPKFFGSDAHFVAANAERDNRFGLAAFCGIKDFHSGFRPEMTRGI